MALSGSDGDRPPIPEIHHIGVIGAGQMGAGIAEVAALAGYQVRLVDVDPAILERSLETIRAHTERRIEKGTLATAEREAALGRIRTGTSHALFDDCELVIEAATEKEDVKRAVFQELIGHLRADALVATNTSSISITRLAAITDRPERFIGMHFMNPVPAMKLVELIRGIATEEAT
jgi:3-hydroxybutyryl-CoA dehydrogenase